MLLQIASQTAMKSGFSLPGLTSGQETGPRGGLLPRNGMSLTETGGVASLAVGSLRQPLRSSAIGLILAGLVYLGWGALGSQNINVLAALAGTSAFLYLALAMDRISRPQAMLSLLAAGSTWAMAYAGLRIASPFLPAAFFLHALFGAIETARTQGDQQRAGLLLTWTLFHLGIAILLTVASR